MNKASTLNICCITGWGADSRSWEALQQAINTLSNITLEWHMLELPMQSNTEVGDLTQVLQRLAESIPERSILFGWSLGGMLSVRIADMHRDKILGVVTLATNASFVQRDSWSEAMPQSVFDGFYSGFATQPEKIQRRFIALQAQGETNRKAMITRLSELSALNEFNRSQSLALLGLLVELDNISLLPQLEQDALHLFGGGDALVPKAAAEKLKQVLTHSRHDVVVIDDCGHAPHLSYVEYVSTLLCEFLEKVAHSDRYHKDKRRIGEAFGKASERYDCAANLQKKIAEKLVRWAPELQGHVLDMGCGTGFCVEALSHRDNIEVLTGLDLAPSMLYVARRKNNKPTTANKVFNWLAGDIESLPFEASSFDALVSSFAIQWCEQPDRVFSEALRVLKPGGLFLVSTPGPQTLHELTQAWKEADPEHVHVNQFVSAENLLQSAQDSGLSVEVFVNEYEQLHYDTVSQLMRELKAIGAHNVNQGASLGLTGRRVFERVGEAYEPFRLPDSQQLPATYEIFYGVFRAPKMILKVKT